MITRAALEEAHERYGNVTPSLLPRWLRQPSTEDEFTLAVLVRGWGIMLPVYDERDVVVGVVRRRVEERKDDGT